MEDFNELNNEPSSGIQPPSPFRSMFGKMTSDMRFVGLFTIIYGAINCLSIIGAVIGIPMIFIGIRMREAADHFDMFKDSNDAKALRRGFESQSRFLNIQKILIIIGIVLFIVSILFMIIGFGAMFSAMSSYQG
ncbi:MAG: DUF5362 domain-containing protein [Ignavibacteriae bacterium]|jgi:hypothetical protein|nr:hypothetical protein [Ignavibacteriota bacterium]NOG98380.1 DUF5362 domain-containing protein [Ignavibacteriota bacterium]